MPAPISRRPTSRIGARSRPVVGSVPELVLAFVLGAAEVAVPVVDGVDPPALVDPAELVEPDEPAAGAELVDEGLEDPDEPDGVPDVPDPRPLPPEPPPELEPTTTTVPCMNGWRLQM
jgi:hypothetical protein